jgi:chromosome segregation ATPase
VFRFLELELHGWDFWDSVRVPLDTEVVVLSGMNGSGKTTMLDAIRQLLHAPRLSQGRRLVHYLRKPGEPALLRAVVSNRQDDRKRRPFERQGVTQDEATLACAILSSGGTPEKRYAILPGRVGAESLQKKLLEGRDWLSPEQYRRALEYAGVSRSLMHILALEQGRADELSRKRPRDLFQWVMEARGSQEILDRYTESRRRYEDSEGEVHRQREAIVRVETDLMGVERQVRRLDGIEEQRVRVQQARVILDAAHLQAHHLKLRDITAKLPELRTKNTNFKTTIERLEREIEDDGRRVHGLRELQKARQTEAGSARTTRDSKVGAEAEARVRLQGVRDQAIELQGIPAEDLSQLRDSLDAARNAVFTADARLREFADLRPPLLARIRDLERGTPRYPDSVERTLAALAGARVPAELTAARVDVVDPKWASAVESALGDLRYAITVSTAHEREAAEIARREGFPGPVVTETVRADLNHGPIRVEGAVPRWFADWLQGVRFVEGDYPAEGAETVTRDGPRRDGRGVWTSRAADRALGSSAIEAQLEASRETRRRLDEEERTVHDQRAEAARRVQDLDTRVRAQERRLILVEAVKGLPAMEASFLEASKQAARARTASDEAERAVQEAIATADRAEADLDRKKADCAGRRSEWEGTRKAVAEMEAEQRALEPSLEDLRRKVPAEWRTRAEAGELPTPPLAEQDLRSAEAQLKRREDEGPIPDPSIRQQRELLQGNLEELRAHVKQRETEAEAAKEELTRCRGEYLGIVRSTIHDYCRRARDLAGLANAQIDFEVPQIENDDKSIAEAGIAVRIGFDGKPPADLGDASHSGGQQVIAGLILLMAMAETEGESFFIIDEPFAHLSLDRIDDVGQFLRRSKSQFLLTVPTTLDRGQLDPASLLVVLRKKGAGEAFAPVPIVARA